MRISRILILFLFSFLFLEADSIKEQKLAINKESNTTLNMLYKTYPKSKNEISNAYGYATFSNIGINLILFSAEGGNGVAVNNSTKERTYMKMASAGVGFGAGVKDFRAIFIFDTKKTFDSFLKYGWEANAQADVAAKSGEKGGSIEGSATVQPGVHLYKLTKNGLALQATIQGTKYWKDSDLN
ncbi:MAG: hypothetical protein HWD90_03810 [Campylobacteraceae bacterium]|nr:hypothetical protein [Campylobacteraceae bacterium]